MHQCNDSLRAVPAEQLDDFMPPNLRLVDERIAWDIGVFIRRYDNTSCLDGSIWFPGCQDHELVLMLKGANRFEFRFDENSWYRGPINSGQLFFIPASTPQEACWHASHQSLHIFLRRALLADVAIQTAATKSALVELRQHLAMDDEFVKQLMQKLYASLAVEHTLNRLYAETVTQMLAVHLLRHHCTVTHNVPEYQSGLSRYRLRAVLDYIHTYLDQGLSLQGMADVVDMNPYHFCRLFKRSMGITPYAYVTQQRIEKAKRLLADTRLSTLEVGLRAGFQNRSHFARTFKQLAGISPTAYRKLR